MEEKVIKENAGKEEGAPVAPGIKFFVAVPSYDRKISVICAQALMNALQVFTLNNIPFEFKFEVGMSSVALVRNSLARSFMESDCTDLIFIDDDLGFPPFAFRDLISAGDEVVAGVYAKKEEEENYAALLKSRPDGTLIIENGMIEADGLPTGFIKIKRTVFEKLKAAYPEDKYMDVRYGKEAHNYFGPFIKDGRWYGDDYGFSLKCSEVGIRLWIIPDITFSHHGSKNYDGNLFQYLHRPNKNGGRFLPGEKEGPTWISEPSAKE